MSLMFLRPSLATVSSSAPNIPDGGQHCHHQRPLSRTVMFITLSSFNWFGTITWRSSSKTFGASVAKNSGSLRSRRSDDATSHEYLVSGPAG